jgi:hypothetical protein
MRYHETQKKAFLHIPRTAGRTIYQNWPGSKEVTFIAKRDDDLGSTHPQHQSRNTLCNAHPFLHDYEWFTVVRNPYYRVISQWIWCLQVLGLNKQEIEDTFHILPYAVLNAHDFEERAFRGYDIPDILLMISSIRGPLKAANSIRLAEQCDKVFKYESIHEVEEYLGVSFTKRVPDVAAKDHYSTYDRFMTSAYIGRINRFYKEEFKQFGYEMIA